MSKRLKGKVALVTGGSSGIGEATARLFIREGAKVGALARTVDELQRAVNRMTKHGGNAIALTADISKPDEMQEAIEKLMGTWGRLDVVFANAGINGVWAPIDELSPEEWRRTIDINLNGTFYTLKYAIPYLKKQGGSIIVTSSVNGTRKFSNSGATAYATSKAGQVALTKMLALELAEYDIRVNVICPGAIRTSIDENTDRQELEDTGYPVKYPEGNIPLRDGKPGTPEQVADLVLFLASKASNHITGTPIWIDGAETLLQG
jgi:NAD(P)-dependent dehydrogenase (short-subunit alcohol dehydrogenase family)